MADCSMSEAEISALKDTLCAQQQLLQKLYNELDAEREASATAASETLSVILRLQEEKAAVKLEAEQYKRLSEEKICHTEESLAIMEDVIYQKEMEVAALDHQVQAYRYRLLSMGCVDPGFGEIKFPDNILQRNDNLGVETNLGSIGRRKSTPVSFKYKNTIDDIDSSSIPETDSVSRTEEKAGVEMYGQTSDLDKRTDNSNHGRISSWEQIRKLDVRVKEIAGADYMNSRSSTRSPPSLSSRLSSGKLCDLSSSARNESNSYQPKKIATMNENDQTKSMLLRNGVAVDYSCTSSVHDVFEVPQVDKTPNSCGSLTNDQKKTPCQSSDRLERENVVHPEAVKMDARYESEWLKKVLQSSHPEKNLCQPSDVNCRLVVVQPTTSMPESHPTLNQPTTSVSESHPTLNQPTRSKSKSHPILNQVNWTSEITEADRPAESTNREEELKLLNEIKDKIDSLHVEIRSWRANKSSTRDEPSLSLLSEAMLYFWL